MNHENRPLTDGQLLRALINSTSLHSVAAMVPQQDRSQGGRPRLYPDWCYVMFHALVSHFRSAHAAERHLEDGRNWPLVRKWSTQQWPHNPELTHR
jgi:hypothetical protein